MPAEFELQKAVYTVLNGIGLRVYDSAPQAADGASTGTFPYVEIGAIILSQNDTFTENAFDIVMRVHTRSRSGSMAEAKNIQGQIYAALHRQRPAVTGFTVLDLWRDSSEVMRASDGSFHGVCEYRGQMV